MNPKLTGQSDDEDVKKISGSQRLSDFQTFFQLGTSSMNSNITGQGEVVVVVKKKALTFSTLNSDF